MFGYDYLFVVFVGAIAYWFGAGLCGCASGLLCFDVMSLVTWAVGVSGC